MRRIILFFVVCVLPLPAWLRAQTAGHRHQHSPAATPTPAPTPSTDESAAPPPRPAPTSASPAAVASIEPSEIEGFEAQPAPIRELLTAAHELTKKNLTYTYGSDDPAKGGMDCSGTISYLLKAQGFTDVPRDASEQYLWTRGKSRVYPVLSKKQDNAELLELRPGDLLFWTGTYNVERDPPVTHTMIYLGRRKKDGHRLMFGASDGRPYEGEKRNGVSVFDFRMPAAREGDAADAATAAVPARTPDFAGYGPIPGMADLTDAASRQTEAAHEVAGPVREHATKGDDATTKSKPSPTPRHPRRS